MPQIIVQIWIKRRKNKKKGDYRDVVRLDMASATPIYVQLRNQIVMGIGTGALKVGEKLPTVRQMAADAGVNTMTVNKTYQLLKAEGFIEIDRRRGAVVNPVEDTAGVFREKLEGELALLGAEAKIKGMNEQEFRSCVRQFLRIYPGRPEVSSLDKGKDGA